MSCPSHILNHSQGNNMSYYLTFLVPILVFIFIWIQQKIIEYKYKIPPGPLRLPGIGCLFQVMRANHKQPAIAFEKLSKKYGNIFSVQLGTVFAVVVNGYDEVKIVEANDDIMDRSNEEWILDRTYGKQLGLLFSSTTYWKETRRYITRTLRDFGFGKTNTMETLITIEFNEFINLIFNEKVKIATLNHEGILMGSIFNPPFVNVIWSLISGQRFILNDPEFHKLVQIVHDVFVAGKIGGGLIGVYPCLKKYIPNWIGFTKMHNTNVTIRKFFEEKIRMFKMKKNYLNNPQNLIEIFLTCMASSESASEEVSPSIDKSNNDNIPTAADPTSFYNSQSRRRHSVLEIFKVTENIFTEENLVSIIYDLFAAGSETTGNVLNFLIIYLIKNPDVQNILREEIDRVVGTSRNVNAEDRAALKYTEATVLEGLRIANTAPISPRRTTQTTYVGPYVVPANTMVLVNLYSANMNTKYWKDPYEFRPERFLNDDGDIINSERIVSFGAGKRNCIGDSIARLSLFLALSSLIQKYTFEIDPTFGTPSTDDILVGLSTSPKPYKALVLARSL